MIIAKAIIVFKQQKYDDIKRAYCKEHNINLIEIPFYDFNKLNWDYLSSLIWSQ